jgi:hypothetical protein
MLLYLIEKTKQTYVLAILANYVFTSTSFDLWMSKRVHDFFSLVMIFLGQDQVSKHIIID